MRHKIYKHIFLLQLLAVSVCLYAVPADPQPRTVTLPDGSKLTIYQKGDEFFKYKETQDGYLIRKNEKGYYDYAILNEKGSIVSTGIRAKEAALRTSEDKLILEKLTTFPDVSDVQIQKRAAKKAASVASGKPSKVYPNTGSPKSLVILVNFKDLAFVTPNPQQAFTDLLNKEGYTENGGTGSARDYFKAASNGISSPEFVVVGPYTLSNNMSYYGGNDENDDDSRPRQMVIDACQLANDKGLDFSQFDTDNDGYVDNVFIYYAGYNEAEHGPDDSIWPHRWALYDQAKRLDGKYVNDYACTSELKGSSGSNMCGIGTFAHEFGHVYGLPDYYATNGATHHTLSTWSIMDYGPYLNQGRTPPTYSAYDRFYLGWLTPEILNKPGDIFLEDIKTSNSAYIITQTGTHNLNGNSPSPVEFFTLENRQKTGWDAYLPNSGMLVTRIYYNMSTWNSNSVNNTATAMGVDIIEADGTASDYSLSGDVFPGSSKVTYYTPTLRSGVDILQPITEIALNNGIISFKFMGGGDHPIINSNADKLTEFRTVAGTPSAEQKFEISGSKLHGNVKIGFQENQYFELKPENDPNPWWSKELELSVVDSILNSTVVLIRYNPQEPSYQEGHADYLKITSSSAPGKQVSLSGISTRPVYVTSPVANEAQDISLSGYTASWNTVPDASGYYLTAYNTSEGSSERTEGFNNGLTAPYGWTIQANSVITNTNYAGDSIPAIEFRNTGDYIQTETYDFPINAFSFYFKSIGADGASLQVEAQNSDGAWTSIETIPVASTSATTRKINVDETKAYSAFRIRYTAVNSLSSVSIDDVTVGFSQQIEYDALKKWVTSTSERINLLLPGRRYYYKVQASDKTLYNDGTLKYENITEFSNTVPIELTLDSVIRFANQDNTISVYKDQTDNIILNLSDFTGTDNTIFIYTTEGKLIKRIKPDSSIVSLSGLYGGRIYIIKIGKAAIKVII